MNLSLIDLADTDSRAESPGVTRTPPTPSAALWDTRGLTAAQAADLHAALSSLPKSFSTQLSQYAQLSSLPQFGSNQFGLQQASYSSKERSAVLSHDRDILSRDFSRDREYYNSKVRKLVLFEVTDIFYPKYCSTCTIVSTVKQEPRVRC